MIKQVSHVVAGAGAADFGLALEVAYDLHAPAPRAPEVATATTGLGAGRRATARRRRTPARG